jgi:hypothetical protein
MELEEGGQLPNVGPRAAEQESNVRDGNAHFLGGGLKTNSRDRLEIWRDICRIRPAKRCDLCQ